MTSERSSRYDARLARELDAAAIRTILAHYREADAYQHRAYVGAHDALRERAAILAVHAAFIFCACVALALVVIAYFRIPAPAIGWPAVFLGAILVCGGLAMIPIVVVIRRARAVLAVQRVHHDAMVRLAQLRLLEANLRAWQRFPPPLA